MNKFKKHYKYKSIKMSMRRFLFYMTISILLPMRMTAQPAEPILRLNSGFHTATIRSISVDAQGYRLLTVS